MNTNPVDFLHLKTLADLADVQGEQSESAAIGAELNMVEAALAQAVERHGALSTALNVGGHAADRTTGHRAAAADPAVIEAKDTVETLRAKRDELTLAAQAAQERLLAAMARARVAHREDILGDLELTLDRYTEGIQAALAVERLLGPTGLHIDVQGELHRTLGYLLVLSDLLRKS